MWATLLQPLVGTGFIAKILEIEPTFGHMNQSYILQFDHHVPVLYSFTVFWKKHIWHWSGVKRLQNLSFSFLLCMT